MKYKILIVLALCLVILACGKKAADIVTDTLVDTLLPSDVTPCDAPAADTPADGTPICGDVSPSE